MIEVKISWEHDPSSNKWLQWHGQENSAYYLHNLSIELNQWFEDNNIYPAYTFDIKMAVDAWSIPSLTFLFENPKDAILFKLRWA